MGYERSLSVLVVGDVADIELKQKLNSIAARTGRSKFQQHTIGMEKLRQMYTQLAWISVHVGATRPISVVDLGTDEMSPNALQRTGYNELLRDFKELLMQNVDWRQSNYLSFDCVVYTTEAGNYRGGPDDEIPDTNLVQLIADCLGINKMFDLTDV